MVIVITGPTGVGKTKLSIELAKKMNGEIINADSTQIFKGLDIATAKVTNEEKENIHHHLIDIKEISEDYTVYDYQKDARKKIDEIIKKNKIPIIVGGTGLYIKAALYDYKFNEEKNKLTYDNIETNELYKELLKVDEKTNIHPNNRKRIIRALNYYNENNEPLSSKEKTDKLLYDTLFIGLTTNRANLYEKINKRVDKMIEEGLLEEAKKIYEDNKLCLSNVEYEDILQDGYELLVKMVKRYSNLTFLRFYQSFCHYYYDNSNRKYYNRLQFAKIY